MTALKASVTGIVADPGHPSTRKAAPRACQPVARLRPSAALGWVVAITLIVAVSPPAAPGLDPIGQTTVLAQTPQPLNPAGGQPGGPPVEPKPGGPLTPSGATYKVDAIEFLLVPDQFVEYKFNLKAGATMLFNWKASTPVDVDFHTVPDGKPISASETFMRGVASSGQGTYRAPYDGLHGWYWKNTGKEDVRIIINASGFFTEARMFSGDPVGEPMEVQDPLPPQ